jgi:hypothetical protein
LEAEPRVLADLANAYRLNGDDSVALTTADEAIRVATERHTRIPEYLARVTRAHLLLRSSGEHRETEAKMDIARSKALMLETGAKLFDRFITELEVNHSNTFQISNDRTALS